jgi:hypothetical protein
MVENKVEDLYTFIFPRLGEEQKQRANTGKSRCMMLNDALVPYFVEKSKV